VEDESEEELEVMDEDDLALLFLPEDAQATKYREELRREIEADMDSDDMDFVAGDDEMVTSASGSSSELGSSQPARAEPSRVGQAKAQKAAALAEIRRRKEAAAAGNSTASAPPSKLSSGASTLAGKVPSSAVGAIDQDVFMTSAKSSAKVCV
jgi:hypothetical protein